MTTSPDLPRALSARAHARSLLSLGLPLIGGQLAQYSVHLTDMVMIGWYDVTALAALTIAGTIFFVFFIVGSGFGWAVMPIVASAAGTDDDRQVRRVTRMGIWLSIFFGAVAMPVLIFAEPLLLVLRQAPEVAEQAGLYLAVASIGMIPNLVIVVLRSYLSALELTRIVLIVTISMALLNAVLNYALIFGNWGAPELGIVGAAVASIVLQIVGVIWLILYAALKTPQYALFRNVLRPDWEAFRRVFTLGWPIGLTNLAEVGLFSASSIMMGWVGTKELAAHGIALQIASATFMVHIGLSQAVTVRAGRAYGRRDEAGLRVGAGVGLALSMAAAFFTILAFLTIPELLIGLFIAPDDPARPELLAIGALLLAAAAVFQFVDAAQVMALGMLRGVQDTRVPMVIAVIAYWGVGLPASLALGFTFGFGAVGIWAGLVVGLAVAGVLFSWRFWLRSSRIGVSGVMA
ncbi:MAG: MATE family efflux transporter [Pseudomonadota bacterium]